jgi:hypothetical protein
MGKTEVREKNIGIGYGIGYRCFSETKEKKT